MFVEFATYALACQRLDSELQTARNELAGCRQAVTEAAAAALLAAMAEEACNIIKLERSLAERRYALDMASRF